MTLLVVYVGFAIGVSFLCSLLEAALLSARLATLTHQRNHGNYGAGLLLEIKQVRIDDAISVILTLNTVANTLGATMAGAQAARVFGSTWVGVFSGILTLLILVVSEIVPKTLGAVYSRQLAGFVGRTLHLMTFTMRPILLLSRTITSVLKSGQSDGLSRGELSAVIATATKDGAISLDEARMLANLLRFQDVTVESVMTPRTVTFMMPISSTVTEMMASPEAQIFSRIPVYRDSPDDVVGYVLQRDVLRAVALGDRPERKLDAFVRPVSFVPEQATVGSALRQMLEARETLAITIDEHGGVAGLVTLEDLTETILGVEIVDESDQVVDMRQAALRLREERLERMRRKREKKLESSS